jgi:hypothetical protein
MNWGVIELGQQIYCVRRRTTAQYTVVAAEYEKLSVPATQIRRSKATGRIADEITETNELHPGYSKPLYLGFSTIADMFFDADPSSYGNYTYAKCNLKWSRPTDYVLNSMHDFMFRSAVAAGNGTEPQIFIAQRANPALVFRSEYHYLAAALAVILVSLLAVLLLLWAGGSSSGL